MPERLAIYLKRRDEALQQAKNEPMSGEAWLRIAQEWQTLHDALARNLMPPEDDSHRK